MRQRIYRLSSIVLALLIVLAAAFGYWQVVRAGDLVSRPDNPRRVELELSTPRGRILDRNGNVLAHSERTANGYYRRVYSEPSLSPVVGLASHLSGNTGIEEALDSSLRGAGPADPVATLARAITRHRPEGDDVVLTIDANLQHAAIEALGGRSGAVVAIDPRNGEIIALVSQPFVDSNRLVFDPAAERWSAESRRIDQIWRTIQSDPSSPLLNRVTQGLYVPGSTYKTVTLAATLEHSAAQPDTDFPLRLNPPDAAHPGWWHEGSYVGDANHPVNQTHLDLRDAYAWSCNVIFAGLALNVGPDAFVESSRRFGIGERPPVEIPAVASRVYTDPSFFSGANRERALAETGMGQGQLEMTPLQMALIAGAPAADGIVYAPHLVKEIRTPEGSTLMRSDPRIWKRAVSDKTAAQMREIMQRSVEIGWARSATSSRIRIAGKTGTAEHGFGDRPPHSWFIGFAPVEAPTIAVAVVEPFSGGGSSFAAPAARAVMERAIGR